MHHKLYEQFEMEFKKYVPQKNCWVYTHESKKFAYLVATSILKEEKVAKDDQYEYHVLLERFYLQKPKSENLFEVFEVDEGYYTAKEGKCKLITRGYNTLLHLYGEELHPKLAWNVTSEFIDLYMYYV
ncbi:TPA: hypothetical protein ACV1G0_004758 [Bacillus cereus]|uniref:hypothetical protein n=1 Tax=Bacillus cereus group TaxID=86661 RepID=UPI002A27EE6E|nr:hypothetical protein [Bacillus anthracis]MDA2511269.1 hypothetical protein [Bacillus cereus]MEC0015637.1 hypothetical protein [Bacillus anthracis]